MILPGAVRQNGCVVRDLDQAIGAWSEIGVGPWLTLREVHQPGSRYRNQTCAPTVSIAFANSGPLQIELIQPLDETPNAYREFLESGRQGLHHLAWWAQDFEDVFDRAVSAGWPVVQSGDGNGVARFAYFERESLSTPFIELMEYNDATRFLADTVAEAAANWDGVTEPARPLF